MSEKRGKLITAQTKDLYLYMVYRKEFGQKAVAARGWHLKIKPDMRLNKANTNQFASLGKVNQQI